jgi:hypothetical protein
MISSSCMLPETSSLLSGLKSKLKTDELEKIMMVLVTYLCPWRLMMTLPSSTSQSFTCLSKPAEPSRGTDE